MLEMVTMWPPRGEERIKGRNSDRVVKCARVLVVRVESA